MIFALFTSICWSISGFASSRISRSFGAGPANLLRLSLASCILACICLLSAQALWIPHSFWFLLAGFSHLALGDLALFASFRRLGPRLGVLMVGSLAPPIALIIEWLVLGTTLTALQILCAGGVLLLVAVAIAPRDRQHLHSTELKLGLLFGSIAALGQGLGTSLQRIGYVNNNEIAQSLWTVTFLRVGAGALGVLGWICLLKILGKNPFSRPRELIPHHKVKGHPMLWLSISTLLGPIVGMFFLITALETVPAALVQATIATMPVFMIPVAWLLDGNKPSIRSILSGCAAVGLTAWLMLL